MLLLTRLDYERDQTGTGGIANVFQANAPNAVAIFLRGGHDQRLVFNPTARATLLFPADVALVDFDPTAERFAPDAIMHRRNLCSQLHAVW